MPGHLSEVDMNALLDAVLLCGMFREIDVDNSGFLTRKEVEDAVSRRKAELEKEEQDEKDQATLEFFEELHRNFDKADTNNDDVLSIFEFNEAFKQAKHILAVHYSQSE